MQFNFYTSLFISRLTLPGKIVEDGQESVKYEVDKGEEKFLPSIFMFYF